MNGCRSILFKNLKQLISTLHRDRTLHYMSQTDDTCTHNSICNNGIMYHTTLPSKADNKTYQISYKSQANF